MTRIYYLIYYIDTQYYSPSRTMVFPARSFTTSSDLKMSVIVVEEDVAAKITAQFIAHLCKYLSHSHFITATVKHQVSILKTNHYFNKAVPYDVSPL